MKVFPLCSPLLWEKREKESLCPKRQAHTVPCNFLMRFVTSHSLIRQNFLNLDKISWFHPFRDLHQQKLIPNVWLRPYKQRWYVGTRHHGTKISDTRRCAVCIFFLHRLERLDEICNMSHSIIIRRMGCHLECSDYRVVSHARVGHAQVKSSLVTSKHEGELLSLGEPDTSPKGRGEMESNRINSIDERRHHPMWERHREMLCRPHASLRPVSCPGVSWYVYGVLSCCHTRSSWTWGESDRLPSITLESTRLPADGSRVAVRRGENGGGWQSHSEGHLSFFWGVSLSGMEPESSSFNAPSQIYG